MHTCDLIYKLIVYFYLFYITSISFLVYYTYSVLD